MPSPFPGMNPYLEYPDFWSDFHNRLIVALADALTSKLLPKYQVLALGAKPKSHEAGTQSGRFGFN